MPPPGGAASNAGENVTRLPRPFSGRGSFSAPARRDGISPHPFRFGTISPLLSEEKCNIMEEEIERRDSYALPVLQLHRKQGY